MTKINRKKPFRLTTKDSLEMANGCLDMIRERLIGYGLPMEACPPMFYPEAIHNVFVAGVMAARVCQRDHNWHNEDLKKLGKCIKEQTRTHWANRDKAAASKGKRTV